MLNGQNPASTEPGAVHLAAAGARAARTVSRVLAWAREIGLLVVVEPGASAEFLGTDTGRTPTYALVSHTPLPHLRPDPPAADLTYTTAGQSTVDESPYHWLSIKATVTREIPEDDPVEGPRLTAHIDRMARKYLGVERYELRDPGREEQRILFELRVDRVATFGRP